MYGENGVCYTVQKRKEAVYMERQTGKRCPWANTPLEIAYHDGEWGRPLHDEGALFELLELEGFQAGLSWSLILERRRPCGRPSRALTRKSWRPGGKRTSRRPWPPPG